MYLILSKQKLNKNVLVDISEPHFFQSNALRAKACACFVLLKLTTLKAKEFTI